MSGHNMAAPGFGQTHDPFADLSKYDDDLDALNFEDTYDGLGDNLDETDDAFNDDTFGGDDTFAAAPVGKDFDFFGATSKVTNAMEEEHALFSRQQPITKTAPPPPPSATAGGYQGYSPYPVATRAARSGYEKYQEPEPVADLQVDASIWGTAPKRPTPAAQPTPPAAASRKVMMSLEEVEAAMRVQSAPKPAAPQPVQQPPQPQFHAQQAHPQHPRQDSADLRYAQPELQQQAFQSHDVRQLSQPQTGGPHGHPITILQRPSSKHTVPTVPSPLAQQHQPQPQAQSQPSAIAPTQILQNPNRMSADAARIGHSSHRSQNSFSRQAPSLPASQLANLSEQEKSAFLDAEARRAKRNHKIHMLSRDNGLMTPHDKSFITRIQLQQLVSAIGDPADASTDAALGEDFYYQVHSSLKAANRPNPNQPLNNFAQTYLFQTGNRHGGMRRHGRGPENHVQRMEQQVQRAVEAAKNKPKNKQLVIEGSLGKISFSNAKTPKPLLNIKRTESSGDARPGSAHRSVSINDRKVALRAIEDVYSILMKMEDHERTMPPPNPSPTPEAIQEHDEWRAIAEKLNGQLWDALKIHEQIDPRQVHPFITFLSYPKGKKAIPRAFRQLSHEQRTTILTLIIVHLDQLDVVQGAQVQSGEPINLPANIRESIDLFSMAVMPQLFNLFAEAELQIVTAVLSIIIQRLNIDTVARTRIGISMLTMILSRAEIIKQGGLANEQLWQQWAATFNGFFNHLEPTLPNIFPGTVTSGEDIYVWQFLAAIGIGASPEEQQRLVLAVKDRVMDTVAMSKTLPADMAKQRLDNVNLFMRSIGLDVELLQ
ncbi:putative mRNA decay factor PAT1 domain-containing protein [Seiridium unicorne]|uniref:mRNA decay factor PAT1 domain-containing protein n=1 Tax=Seiridium unicorne TaxID=138068 RepID=A0ABR2UIY9_9PEZI